MTVLAILFMLVAVSLVTTLAAWCYFQVLRRRDPATSRSESTN